VSVLPGDGAPEPGVIITVCPDGPLLVRGPVTLLDADDVPIDPRRRTVALCRCGKSAIRPFCDGSHRHGFRCDGHDSRPAPAQQEPDAG
jgi:CDGSH-type Zn-finger protein